MNHYIMPLIQRFKMGTTLEITEQTLAYKRIKTLPIIIRQQLCMRVIDLTPKLKKT